MSLPANGDNFWETACSRSDVSATFEHFLEVTNLLLEQVQLNSSHLFRADILYDSSGKLRTLQEKEAKCRPDATTWQDLSVSSDYESSSTYPALSFADFGLQRTVVRRLIPRKPQLDKPLKQSCFIYNTTSGGTPSQVLVVYLPHCSSPDEMPWYHPKVKALAYLYSKSAPSAVPSSSLSVHYLRFSSTPSPLPDRLQRTFISLLNTMIRLLKLPPKSGEARSSEMAINHNVATMPLTAAALKDTILPQHIVQNTYTRLKETYAADLINRWIETTEPSKHVFEDLSIAAFLIELWNDMYSLTATDRSKFPGFVDIACGNGVLVYILIKEGFHGHGFDARRRKTWEVLGVDEHIKEKICIPKPFLDVLATDEQDGMTIHNGTFQPDTFIVSNHADELTCWTPIIAALSSLAHPLPFLAIPCCSHALDGSKHRYTLKEVSASLTTAANSCGDVDQERQEDEQPITGDLKAMRAAKQKGTAGADDKSMYACLTRKTAALAQELDMRVELTLMRIPSTRNIGVVGNRKEDSTRMHTQGAVDDMKKLPMNGQVDQDALTRKMDVLIERECSMTGGINASAKTWLEKARKLQGGQGRGKVNWNGPLHRPS